MNPAAKVRPIDKITDLNWKPPGETPEQRELWQKVNGKKMVDAWHVESLQNCSACHR